MAGPESMVIGGGYGFRAPSLPHPSRPPPTWAISGKPEIGGPGMTGRAAGATSTEFALDDVDVELLRSAEGETIVGIHEQVVAVVPAMKVVCASCVAVTAKVVLAACVTPLISKWPLVGAGLLS
jgi:hypothetical protein